MVDTKMVRHGRKRADDLLALGIARGLPIKDAAAGAALSERSAYRRASSAEFQDRVRALRGEMLASAVSAITATLGQATDTLSALLTAQSESVRLGAARTILEMGLKLREHADLERRLRELEERADEKDDDPRVSVYGAILHERQIEALGTDAAAKAQG